MADAIDSSADVPENDRTSLAPTRRVSRKASSRRAAGRAARTALTATAVRTAPRRAAKAAAKPARSLATLAVVAGLVATVALPAYGAWKPTADAVTLQQVAEDGAQSLVVASAADTPELARDTYAATTPEEIQKKKAEDAAKAAAAERARRAATVASTSTRYNVDLNMVAPGSGAVRWPLTGYTQGDGFMSRGGSHQGVDMLTAGGSPIFAAAAGVVRVSQESYGGYGVAVTIDHVINGQSVSTLYGHMTYGSRQVVSGQTVEAGQLIGLVGSTGRSTANHLHFEVRVGGQLVDPIAFLQANAG
ncbi:MAG TPA: M23 family metallopeptidase [Microbacterium sp.]|uniref:M23 family metallopeptidase n=1 Tax=Microbacterium sp. TaxID=51671 RepID=UPI002BB6D5F4|nr:M23 family metallopeptidase [Microbacterium sp.]HWI31585.1 M23 family metallopeptidase [Microbacterium sp.]